MCRLWHFPETLSLTHVKRGLSDTDVTDGRAAGGDTDEVRADEEELFTGTQEGDLHRTSAERQTERASADHSGTGR